MANSILNLERLTIDDENQPHRLAVTRSKAQPRRHFITGTKPQVLIIPQEITDLIVEVSEDAKCDSDDFIRNVTITFDFGLFSHFTKIMFQIGFNFRFDEQGIEAITHLAGSRFAPFVQRVRFADRQPSPHILTLRPDGTSAGLNREMSNEKPRATGKADVLALWAK